MWKTFAWSLCCDYMAASADEQRRITIEVCIDSVESAESAIRGGADRLEVCGNLAVGGGTTPSLGLVNVLHKRYPSVPLMVMVRPRVGDFLYSSGEIETMREDIRLFKQAGVAGVVIGLLTSAGAVDVEATAELVQEARPLQVCFHRAFDTAKGPAWDTYDALRSIGVTRILTSGGSTAVTNSFDVIVKLLEVSASNESGPTILPGAGINAKTISSVLTDLLPHGLTEVHLSGGKWRKGIMAHRHDGLGMGAGGGHDWDVWRTEEAAVRAVREAVDAAVTRRP
ncbi:hypothetical protein PENSPDRAFT_426348 [Peniophora sp. CONT]|nr:hypothetical protein PENSPDRAFT_426348 [Peniophora sp. CONT]